MDFDQIEDADQNCIIEEATLINQFTKSNQRNPISRRIVENLGRSSQETGRREEIDSYLPGEQQINGVVGEMSRTISDLLRTNTAFFTRTSPPVARPPSLVQLLVRKWIWRVGERAIWREGERERGILVAREREIRLGRLLSPTASPRRSPRFFCQGSGELSCRRPLCSAVWSS
jgi:hypothetical protein